MGIVENLPAYAKKKERHELLSNLCHWFASKRGYHCTKQKQFTGHLATKHWSKCEATPQHLHLSWWDCHGILTAHTLQCMTWINGLVEGNNYRKTLMFHGEKKLGFRCRFSLNQSIDWIIQDVHPHGGIKLPSSLWAFRRLKCPAAASEAVHP